MKTNTLFLALFMVLMLACGLLPQGTQAVMEWQNTPNPATGTATVTVTATGTGVPAKCAEVTALRSVWVRESPGGGAVYWYGRGQIVEVTGAAVDGWLPVRTNLTKGWVYHTYLTAVACNAIAR